MKVCTYCGSTIDDSLLNCPHCASTIFRSVCYQCGETYVGPFCPACREREEAARAAAQANYEKEQAEDKANEGLVWKTALTFFLPFVGGYFLIKEHVKSGFRLFGIAWCSLFALILGFSEDGTLEGNIVGALLCLAPFAVYVYKTRNSILKTEGIASKLPLIAFAVVFVISMAGCLYNAC